MKLKRLAVALGLLTAVYGVVVAALYVAMRQPPEIFGAVMSKVPMPAMLVLPFRNLWMTAREGALRVGDSAPDFSLPGVHEDRILRLSEEFSHRPVVLVFGSFT
jgi:hypothetical protein